MLLNFSLRSNTGKNTQLQLYDRHEMANICAGIRKNVLRQNTHTDLDVEDGGCERIVVDIQCTDASEKFRLRIDQDAAKARRFNRQRSA